MAEIKLFGKSLFSFNKRSDVPMSLADSFNKESKFIPDFYDRVGGVFESVESYVTFQAVNSIGSVVSQIKTRKKKEPKKVEVVKKTPKEVFELQLLHDEHYKLNTDPAYVDGQLADFKDKLNLIKSEEYDMRNGVKEIGSIVMRLENRKKYPEHAKFFEEFAYTTTTKIDALVKAHDYLQIGQIAQFMADMPKEATQVMKDYNKECDALCGKQAVFYIIADKKDFKKTNQRRDPILLAQSPFGHVWQILGAWDKEMLFIEEL